MFETHKRFNHITKYVIYLTIFITSYRILHNQSYSSCFSLNVSYKSIRPFRQVCGAMVSCVVLRKEPFQFVESSLLGNLLGNLLGKL